MDLVVERPYGKDALRALLHLILFHRLFGNIRPRITEIFDLTLPAIDDSEIDNLVNIKVDSFWRTLESSSNARAQMTVVFSEMRTKKTWFSSAEEEVPWENWIVVAQLTKTDPQRDGTASTSRSHLKRAVQTAFVYADESRDIVPPMRSHTMCPFPMNITVSRVPDSEPAPPVRRSSSYASSGYGRS